jgi:hypothetical protein
MFSVGQKVVCIADKWQSWETRQEVSGPKNGDILKIERILVLDGLEYLVFFGDSCGYVSDKFRPLDYDFVEHILKQVTPEPIPA